MGYARFFLHAVDHQTQLNFLECARYSLKTGGKLCIECRSNKGQKPDDIHYRRLIDKDELINELIEKYFEVEYVEERTGFSVYKDEDPVLIRIVAINKNCTKYSPPCNSVCACCTQKLRDLLFDIVDLFEQEKIRYWVDFGTLLGAVRHQDIIAWDCDVDLCVWKEDYKKVVELKAKLEKLNYDFLIGKTTCKVYPSVYNHKLWADIYFWENVKGGKYKNINPAFDGRISSFPVELLGGFAKVKICGRDFVAPKKYHEKLKKMYDDYMIEKRITPYWNRKKKR